MNSKTILQEDTMTRFLGRIMSFAFLVLMAAGLPAREIRPTFDIGALKTAIEGAQAGDVIILERGKVYYNQATIDLKVNLTIRDDEKTTGKKPIIAPLVKQDGTVDKYLMLVHANLTCINIHFHAGITGSKTDDGLYGINFTEKSNLRFILTGCWFEDWDRRALILESPDMRVYFTDCIWVDDHKLTGTSEGRSIDLREFGPDTLIIQNCTFVNVADRWIRHLPNAGKLYPINYAVIDHCTFLNGLNYRPAIDLGHVEKLKFTNNIMYNPGILGSDFMRRPSKNSGAKIIAKPAEYYSTNAALVPHRVSEVYYDRADGIVVLGCHGVDSTGTKITMQNNNCYMEKAILDKIATNDTLKVCKWWSTQFRKSIVGDTTKAFISELLKFIKAPAPAVGEVNKYVGYWDQNAPNTTMFRTAPDSMDLSYGTTAVSYTAGEGGFPLGDLNWYPTKKTAWRSWVTGVNETQTVQPADFTLSQNYPNPFNPVTVIHYSIGKSGDVALDVYSTIGQKVRTLVSGHQTSGQYQITWDGKDDAGNAVSSGIYVYRLKAGNQTFLKKMTMMK